MSGNVRQLAKEAINYVAEQPFVRSVCRRTLNNFQNTFLGNPKFRPDWIKKFLPQNIAYSRPYISINVLPQNTPFTCLFWRQTQQNLLMDRLKRRLQFLPISHRRAFAHKPNPLNGNTKKGDSVTQRITTHGNNSSVTATIKIIKIIKRTLGAAAVGAVAAAGTYIICENYTEHELCNRIREKLGLKKK